MMLNATFSHYNLEPVKYVGLSKNLAKNDILSFKSGIQRHESLRIDSAKVMALQNEMYGGLTNF